MRQVTTLEFASHIRDLAFTLSRRILMTIPRIFSKEAVAEASKDVHAPYQDFVHSHEPYRSLLKANPWLAVPKSGESLTWGKAHYYDTTVARKHPDWQYAELPQPSQEMDKLRRDFYHWGYCLIRDGLSPAQTENIRTRVVEQSTAERQLGIAYLAQAQQHVWSLVNKGEVFVQCMSHEPDSIQAGPMIEQLLDEALGRGWHHLSYIANIAYPGCHPQGMHQDQSLAAPYHFLEAPVLVNTVYILQDVNENNGGTLIIPGSHKLYCEGGGTFGEVPRPINLEAPAGTIMLMDGRVLHGGAVNHTDELRYIITNSLVRPFIRQQESFHLTIRPDILQRANDKFLWRCGFQATGARSTVEGYGYFGSGGLGDANGALVHMRNAMDAGVYQYIGELRPGDSLQNQSLPDIQKSHETLRDRAQAMMQQIDSGIG